MNASIHDGFETGSHRGSVVVGVDGSDHADRAIVWAARQAVLEHRPLTLLHGFNPIGRTTVGALALEGTDRYELLHVLRRDARTMLEEALALAQKTEPDLEVHPVLVDADARTALVDASRTARLARPRLPWAGIRERPAARICERCRRTARRVPGCRVPSATPRCTAPTACWWERTGLRRRCP